MAKTEKVSIALRKDALVQAKKVAAAEGLSLSGLVMKLLDAHFERLKRFERMDRFIDDHASDIRVTEADMQAIRDEMTAPLRPVRRSKKTRAA